MHTRTIALGICATVVGILAGSVAMGAAQDLAGSAVPYRAGVKPGNEYRIRHLKTAPVTRASSSSSVASSEAASASSAAPAMTSCDGARAALADMADVIYKTVPVQASNTAMLETLATARFAIQNKYCSEPVPSSSSSVSSVRALPAHPAPSVCDDLMFGTARYIQCVLDHAMGTR